MAAGIARTRAWRGARVEKPASEGVVWDPPVQDSEI